MLINITTRMNKNEKQKQEKIKQKWNIKPQQK